VSPTHEEGMGGPARRVLCHHEMVRPRGHSVSRRHRLLTMLAAFSGALFIAGTAQAGFWQFGPQWLAHGSYDDASCYWYRGSAACSGSNYWQNNQYDPQQGGSYKYLLGYETPNAIRGTWITGSSPHTSISPCAVGWCGWYTRAHITWWEGNGAVVLAYANA
jgi:hypothetical protein